MFGAILLWAVSVVTVRASLSLYPGPSKTSADVPQALSEHTETSAEHNKGASLFNLGYQHFVDNHHDMAVVDLYRFLREHTPDDKDYEWAEFFFGISLNKLGYTHAAVDTLTNVIIRKPNPKIVTYALKVLEEISRTRPFDRDLLVNRALCDQSYGFVEGRIADFVHYYQGEYDWEHGLFSWGDDHFMKISQNTFYYHKFQFKKALRELYGGNILDAMALLKDVIAGLPDKSLLKDDARKTLARLYYENGDYQEADFLYLQIEMNIVDQASNLLERAWAHYRMGNPERAMGLLYSFEAPSYTNSFTPEFYILKSFIYKDVCHYEKAMQVLEQFKRRYGSALTSIYHRGSAADNEAMLMVILNKPKVNRAWKFINLLEKESAMCLMNTEPDLKSFLSKLYELKMDETKQTFKLMVNDQFEKMADSMLRFEEDANLMEYEIGLDMYQRVYADSTKKTGSESQGNENTEKKAVYQFQGEFWNDELDDYQVKLPNKCQNSEEWDIFFK